MEGTNQAKQKWEAMTPVPELRLLLVLSLKDQALAGTESPSQKGLHIHVCVCVFTCAALGTGLGSKVD